MSEIKPLQKNKRICEKCNATYCINGDSSDYWCELPEEGILKEGNCEFCSPRGKWK